MCTVFPRYLEFVDLKSAFLFLYYWAALALFYRTVENVQRIYQQQIPPESISSREFATAYSSPTGLSLKNLPPFFATTSQSHTPLAVPTLGKENRQSLYQTALLSSGISYTAIKPSSLTPVATIPQPLFPAALLTSSHNNPNHVPPTHAADGALSSASAPATHHVTQSPYTTTSSQHTFSTPLASPPFPTTTEPVFHTAEMGESPLDLAHNICRALPFVLDRTLHSLGPDQCTWPIWAALQIFKSHGSSSSQRERQRQRHRQGKKHSREEERREKENCTGGESGNEHRNGDRVENGEGKGKSGVPDPGKKGEEVGEELRWCIEMMQMWGREGWRFAFQMSRV
jgi:hypothetical protein